MGESTDAWHGLDKAKEDDLAVRNRPVKWGIVGTGSIADIFASELPLSSSGRLVAVASRDGTRAAAFAADHRADRWYGSYEELLADPTTDAVYVATPHTLHVEWTIRAAEAGKHVLCEKPMALNQPQAMAAVEAARCHGVLLMEAFAYRCQPQTAKLVELVADGSIGELRLVEASYGFAARYDRTSRLYAPELGGGAILDVGCYPASIAVLLAGVVASQDPLAPVEVAGTARLAESGVDELALATARFKSGLLAQLSCSISTPLDNVVRLRGSTGSIDVAMPWFAANGTKSTAIVLHREGREPEPFTASAIPPYAAEADAFAAHIGKIETSEMPVSHTLATMATLDRWRTAAGVIYPEEAGIPATATRRRLVRRDDAVISCDELPGLGKSVSRVVLGVYEQETPTHMAIMCDDFVERGGTCFDTAHVYGEGRLEALFGRWMTARGNRDEIVVVGKGAHTPDCYPEALTAQLHESLERLGTDHVDVYLMHRDNAAVPVGEFIDVLNEHVDAGSIVLFGASNWSIERFSEANEYARREGKRGMVALSNHFSLAQLYELPWPGCVGMTDRQSVAWLERSQIPLFPWSSQARGFFAGRSDGLVRCWQGKGNDARRDRVRVLAERRSTTPSAVALAYVLCQPFPTFPLIGPQALSETTDSLRAFQIDLDPAELRWLEEGDGGRRAPAEVDGTKSLPA